MEEIKKEISNAVNEALKEFAYLHKDVLTLSEVAMYTGLTKSHLYKLTMNKQIPYYKPTGGTLFFDRQEVVDWLHTNRISTDAELCQKAQQICQRGGAR